MSGDDGSMGGVHRATVRVNLATVRENRLMRGVDRLMGMSSERMSSLGALMDTARRNLRKPGVRASSARRRIPSTLPTVETDIRAGAIEGPLRSLSTRMA